MKVLYVTQIGGFLFPSNGGQLRTHHVLSKLCQNHSVDVYCPKLSATRSHGRALKNFGIQKNVTPWVARALFQFSRYRGSGICLRILGRLVSKMGSFVIHPSNLDVWLADRFVCESTKYDFVILDTLQLHPCRVWKAPNRQVWLNAHNVESVLSPNNEQFKSVESNLSRLIDGVICCTASDERRFQAMNNQGLKTVCWPNGTVIPRNREERPKTSGKVLFVGSLNYGPNIAGLRWYLEHVHCRLFDVIPDYSFTIAGRNPDPAFVEELSSYPRVDVIPDAPDLSKLYFTHHASVVPLLHGSGSRLKIPESLIHDCPIVSTSIGAEGYDESNIPGLTIADSPESFASCLAEVLTSTRENGKTIANYATTHFTWSKVIQLCDIGLVEQ